MSDKGSTYNVISMREVKTGNVHASVEHLDEHLDVPTGGSESANDLGLALIEVNLLKNVLESNTTAVG